MMLFLITVAAFVLMMLADMLKLTRLAAASPWVFLTGAILLVVTGIWAAVAEEGFGIISWVRIVFLLVAVVALILEIWSLLIALPFGPAYLARGDVTLVDHGMYALCRHPGALWLPLFLVSLSIALDSRALMSVALTASVMNLMYVWMQDRYVFPHTIRGYDQYQRTTPFVLPTRSSLREALRTIHQKKDDGHEI